MAQILKYVIGKDYRPLTVLEAKGGNTFTPDYDKTNWVQARQYEDSLRQVFVEITNEDGSAYDLTGANVLFEGILPDNEHKILDNSHVVFYEDPTTGKFRFDMPAQAFSVAGQYKQAFFRVVKDYRNIATLEFKFEVLADMVVTGLVPRDYISPLDDLFNTIKETETKNVTELKKIVDEKINEITDLMTTLNQTNTATLGELNSAKTALEALEKKIKQDGLFTQSDVDVLKADLLKDVKSLLNTTVGNINQSFSSLGNNFIYEKNSMSTSIDSDMANSILTSIEYGDDILNISLITDAHIEPSERYSKNGANHYLSFGYVSKLANVDLMIANGDNIDGTTGSQNDMFNSSEAAKDIIRSEQESMLSMLSGAKGSEIPLLINKGNHDTGAFKAKKSGPNNSLSNSELLKLYNSKGIYGEVRDENSFYWYKDFPKQRIRVIGLNSEDTTDEVSENLWTENDVNSHKFSEKQLRWLVDIALKNLNGFSVVFFWHAPLNKAFGKSNTVVNGDTLKEILISFKNGTTQTISSTDENFTINTSFDAPGDIIAIFNGHYHEDAVDDATIPGINMIEQDCAACFLDIWTNSELKKDRLIGTKTETAWDIISIDTTKRVVEMYRYGAGNGRSFRY